MHTISFVWGVLEKFRIHSKIKKNNTGKFVKEKYQIYVNVLLLIDNIEKIVVEKS